MISPPSLPNDKRKVMEVRSGVMDEMKVIELRPQKKATEFSDLVSFQHTAREDSFVEAATPPPKSKSKTTKGRPKRTAQNEDAPRQTAWTNEGEITLCKGWIHVSENSKKVAMTKVIKEEFEKLGLLEIDEDLFTYDTQLGMIFNEFNRLCGINDDLFAYEIEVPKPTPCVEQTSDPTHNDLGEYEWKMSYEECEKIYAEAEGVIGTRLIRSYKLQFDEYLEIKRQRDTYAREVDMEYNPSNLVFAEWLASKFYNHLEMDWYTM
ncbi:hypothetical protein Tco_0410196 [Tanacetum coccineum]